MQVAACSLQLVEESGCLMSPSSAMETWSSASPRLKPKPPSRELPESVERALLLPDPPKREPKDEPDGVASSPSDVSRMPWRSEIHAGVPPGDCAISYDGPGSKGPSTGLLPMEAEAGGRCAPPESGLGVGGGWSQMSSGVSSCCLRALSLPPLPAVEEVVLGIPHDPHGLVALQTIPYNFKSCMLYRERTSW